MDYRTLYNTDIISMIYMALCCKSRRLLLFSIGGPLYRRPPFALLRQLARQAFRTAITAVGYLYLMVCALLGEGKLGILVRTDQDECQ